jgi:hypothetical protein
VLICLSLVFAFNEVAPSAQLEDLLETSRRPPIRSEASLKCRSFWKGRYAPPVHMIRLTEQRQTVPYVWVHPDEERDLAFY